MCVGEFMKLQKLLSLLRQGIEKYEMIKEGDKIAIGVSGGKDSLALLYAMKELSRFYPKEFTICAISVDLGFENTDFAGIENVCRKLGVEFHLINTQIGEIVLKERKEKNPCSLCAKMRKGALVEEALRLHCNKIAYAHHKDDFVETMLLSLLFQGQFYAFPPVTNFEEQQLQVLRPFIFVEEAQIKGFCNKYEIPVMKSPCPVDGTTKRQYVKNLASQIQKEHSGAKQRMFHAIVEGNIYDWIVPNQENKKSSTFFSQK